jgi:hypothetical protein
MAKKYLDDNGLLYFWGKIKAAFITKDGSKQLSDENYTSAEKTKLASVAKNAKDNVIESISVNGTPQTVTNKNVDLSISSSTGAYTAKGAVAFEDLPALDASREGFVYNITNAFTTTSDFVEGAGSSYPAGTNVVIINTTGNTYKYDCLSGIVDLSAYQLSADLIAITNSEIDTIVAS